MKTSYPTELRGIGAWARDNSVGVVEARVRFAQYGVLRAVAGSRRLSEVLVLKGGNALDFVWSPNQSTQDLDFTAIDLIEGAELRALLEQSLGAVQRDLGTLYRVQRVERQPPGAEKTFVTFAVSVGYALEDQVALRRRLEAGQMSPSVVPLDVSLNEVVCDDTPVDLVNARSIRVCTREDIVAEKLRSLLQQPLRNRYRRQDLLDIAVLLDGEPLDLDKVARFLALKAASRGVTVTKSAFRAAESAHSETTRLSARRPARPSSPSRRPSKSSSTLSNV